LGSRDAEHFDIIIVGSGLSGNDAYHLQTSCPSKSYVILESRDAIGGTRDLFRYPCIGSDFDRFTLWLSVPAVPIERRYRQRHLDGAVRAYGP
jgi:cation diffusion facilitator CzcD-associated flavoprotein CzcO